MRRLLAALLAANAFAAWAGHASAAEEVVTITTRPGVSVSYLLVTERGAPEIVVMSLVGGRGALGLSKRVAAGRLHFGPGANALVRMRDAFGRNGLADAIVDAPSDQLPDGMSDEFRLGPEHAADLAAVAADLRKRFPATKLYVMGTSRGTTSAAAFSAAHPELVAGTVLTSTVTKADRLGPNLSRFDWTLLKGPVLLVHHRDDGCGSSPYRGAVALERFPLVTVEGGDPAVSGPCEPQSAHGFLGREAETAAAITHFMLGRDFPRRIS